MENQQQLFIELPALFDETINEINDTIYNLQKSFNLGSILSDESLKCYSNGKPTPEQEKNFYENRKINFNDIFDNKDKIYKLYDILLQLLYEYHLKFDSNTTIQYIKETYYKKYIKNYTDCGRNTYLPIHRPALRNWMIFEYHKFLYGEPEKKNNDN